MRSELSFNDYVRPGSKHRTGYLNKCWGPRGSQSGENGDPSREAEIPMEKVYRITQSSEIKDTK